MFIIIPMNGLLNRIRAILSAKILADRLKLQLFIIWKPDCRACNCLYNDIFQPNTNLWSTVSPNEFEEFAKTHRIPNCDSIPRYLREKNDICTLAGYFKGEQRFIERFANSKKKIKIIKGGGNFFIGDKEEYDFKKSEIYQKILFCNIIYSNLPTVVPKTLGVHLRYSDGFFRRHPLKNEIIISEIDKFILNYKVENIIIISDLNNKKKQIFDIINKKYPLINPYISKVKNMGRNNYTGLQGAMTDWLTLTRCDSIIFTSGSSFGFESYAFDRNKIVSEIPRKNLLTSVV